MMTTLKQRADLTFRHNLKYGRHGWLRLTPAYSIKIVQEILDAHSDITDVLDPFSGTGTTGLVCAERGVRCDLVDINPFLVWLARVKTANYTSDQLNQVNAGAQRIVGQIRDALTSTESWTPPISNIERWWTLNRLFVLARLFHALNEQFSGSSPAKDLLLLAFCRVLIQWSNAAFNHQSMSFKENGGSLFENDVEALISQTYLDVVQQVIETARSPLAAEVRVFQHDSREGAPYLADRFYDGVITSPPYPNRMSYIRELRPYMYWLGYLNEAREAGELDWQAIGGTWGVATSRLQKWRPNDQEIRSAGLVEAISAIARQSPLLANYVHKYFVDISRHLASLHRALTPGARLFYIVGNAKFYETLVPVEAIYADLLRQHGYTDISVAPIRKRNSKKELLEFVVSARKLNLEYASFASAGDISQAVQPEERVAQLPLF